MFFEKKYTPISDMSSRQTLLELVAISGYRFPGRAISFSSVLCRYRLAGGNIALQCFVTKKTCNIRVVLFCSTILTMTYIHITYLFNIYIYIHTYIHFKTKSTNWSLIVFPKRFVSPAAIE